ncbi:MAG TPA: xanthine dehydrogenase family protein subunit M [Candidatus Xenobia bacterium]|nr:xanthine dehydrogenase family protein subunit M [Candidatus Xenobia bacterium]
MIPGSFDYFAPRSLQEAFDLLAEHGDDAKLLAGGHSLLPLMKLRLAAPRVLVDLGRIGDLAYIREEGDEIAIGAMTTHAAIEHSELLRRRARLLGETAAEIGDVQVRNRGTLGGSLVHADPAADYPAAVLALGAQLVLTSRSGQRTVPASDFFVDLLTTAIQPGEILTEIRFAADGPRTGSAYCKLHQPASGFALVGVAARVRLDATGKCEAAAVGVTGVSSKAYRAAQVEKALLGKAPNEKIIAQAAAKAAAGVEPLSDLHASARYRKAMAETFTRKVLAESFSRAKR